MTESKKKEWEEFENFKERWILWDSIDKPLRTSGARTKYTVRTGAYYKNKFGKVKDGTDDA